MNLVTQRPGSSVRSGNYCCSSIRLASMDENKNSHRKITMTHTPTTCIHRIILCAGKKGARPAEVGALASMFQKSATELKKQKILKCKQTILIATFNVRTLSRIGQLSELTASVTEHNRHNMHTRSQIHPQRGYQTSRYWQWMDTSHCVSIEKLCQCHGRRCKNTYRTNGV